jgi:hypothetical protein
MTTTQTLYVVSAMSDVANFSIAAAHEATIFFFATQKGSTIAVGAAGRKADAALAEATRRAVAVGAAPCGTHPAATFAFATTVQTARATRRVGAAVVAEARSAAEECPHDQEVCCTEGLHARNRTAFAGLRAKLFARSPAMDLAHALQTTETFLRTHLAVHHPAPPVGTSPEVDFVTVLERVEALSEGDGMLVTFGVGMPFTLHDTRAPLRIDACLRALVDAHPELKVLRIKVTANTITV